MRLKQILVGVAVGWTLVSIAGIGYYLLGARSTPAEPGAAEHAAALPPSHGKAPTTAKKFDPELAALLYRYFPKPVAERLEEVFIRDYFQDRRGGFFVDVGASYYRKGSNTHYLDLALGWRGIAIDAIAEYGADYAKYRPHTKYFAAFVSDKSDQKVDFFINKENPKQSSAVPEVSTKFKTHEEVRELPTVTLDALLDSEHVGKVDLLSMDIELWEPKALAGFDIDRFKPALVVIEAHPPVRDELYKYFADHHYVELEKYTKWDGRNAYFVPAEDLPKFLAREAIEPIAGAS